MLMVTVAMDIYHEIRALKSHDDTPGKIALRLYVSSLQLILN